MQLQRKVPAKACRFSADVSLGSNGENAKTAPVTLLARTAEPVDSYFGPVVHDLSGITPSKPRIPLDYCHDDEQVIGYANKFEIQGGDFVAAGALVPYSSDPTDKATEVIYKYGVGVPYGASVFFDEPVLEQVGEGGTAKANGRDYPGPVTIIRTCRLRGIAICPYGRDGGAETAMGFKEGDEVVATILTEEMKGTNMEASSEAKSAEASAEAKTEAPKEPEMKQAEVAKTVEAKTDEVAKTVESKVEEVPDAAATSVETKKTGPEFVAAFGDKGGVWFALGKTFEEAQTLCIGELRTECGQLSAKVQELTIQVTSTRGDTPVSFSAEAEPVKSELNETAARNLGGLAKFAATIKIPN
ncbi:MAG TPA: hypothetical protein VFE46_10790 [Pirellulales bacterium]|jgi:hypothetical protein|nr:hypothetical protein [Pirellulales bacterium]